MPVLFTREKLEQVKRVLDGVRSVGQAWKVIEATQSLANTVHDEIRQSLFEDAWRTESRKAIRNYQAGLERASKSLLGAPATASAEVTWRTSIRTAAAMLWNYCLVVQASYPPNETTAMQRLSQKVSFAADTLATSVKDAPELILKVAVASAKEQAKVVKKTAKAAAEVAKEGLSAAQSVAGSLLGPFKWYLIGAGALVVVGVVAYVALAKKGIL